MNDIFIGERRRFDQCDKYVKPSSLTNAKEPFDDSINRGIVDPPPKLGTVRNKSLARLGIAHCLRELVGLVFRQLATHRGELVDQCGG